MTQLNESLNYHDMKGHVLPQLGIDQFSSKIGDDADLITLNFIVDSKQVAEDLADWLERGYEWIIDADTSPGEVLHKKYYVFAELNRRSTAPRRIIEILDDLETLTDIEVEKWKLKIDRGLHEANKENIEKFVILDSDEYKRQKEEGLNEWRNLAGLPHTQVFTEYDEDIKNWQRQAGII